MCDVAPWSDARIVIHATSRVLGLALILHGQPVLDNLWDHNRNHTTSRLQFIEGAA